MMKWVMNLVLVLYAIPASADEQHSYNVYDKNFTELVATARSNTVEKEGLNHYTIQYFDPRGKLFYEQKITYQKNSLEILSGEYTDYAHFDRASFSYSDGRTIIRRRKGADMQVTTYPGNHYGWSRTILDTVTKNLAALRKGQKLGVKMFTPSATDITLFEYSYAGTTEFNGRKYEKVRARTRNWFYNLILPKITFFVNEAGSAIPLFYGPADYARNKARGVWIIDARIDSLHAAKPGAGDQHD